MYVVCSNVNDIIILIFWQAMKHLDKKAVQRKLTIENYTKLDWRVLLKVQWSLTGDFNVHS